MMPSDTSRGMSLSLSAVDRSDAGMYQCLVTSGSGMHNEQAAAQLTIGGNVTFSSILINLR